MTHAREHPTPAPGYALKWKCVMSPSFMTYALPSARILPGGLDGGFGLVLLEVVERVDLGADEALLEVGVDHAGRLRGGGADRGSSRRGSPSGRR